MNAAAETRGTVAIRRRHLTRSATSPVPEMTRKNAAERGGFASTHRVLRRLTRRRPQVRVQLQPVVPLLCLLDGRSQWPAQLTRLCACCQGNSRPFPPTRHPHVSRPALPKDTLSAVFKSGVSVIAGTGITALLRTALLPPTATFRAQETPQCHVVVCTILLYLPSSIIYRVPGSWRIQVYSSASTTTSSVTSSTSATPPTSSSTYVYSGTTVAPVATPAPPSSSSDKLVVAHFMVGNTYVRLRNLSCGIPLTQPSTLLLSRINNRTGLQTSSWLLLKALMALPLTLVATGGNPLALPMPCVTLPSIIFTFPDKSVNSMPRPRHMATPLSFSCLST